MTSSTALSSSIAILITNEFISKLNLRYTKPREWTNVITLPYGKTLKESMIDTKIVQKEAEQLKQIYNQYIDKRRKKMNSNKFKVEDIFRDVISKDSISPEQIAKLNIF